VIKQCFMNQLSGLLLIAAQEEPNKSLPTGEIDLPATLARIGYLEETLSALRAATSPNRAYFMSLSHLCSSMSAVCEFAPPELQEEIAAFSRLCSDAHQNAAFPSSREDTEGTAARLLADLKAVPVNQRVASYMERLRSAETPLGHLMAELGEGFLAQAVVAPKVAEAVPEKFADVVLPQRGELSAGLNIDDILSTAMTVCSGGVAGGLPLLERAGLDDGNARRAKLRELGHKRSERYQATVAAAKDEVVLPNPVKLPPAMPMKSIAFVRTLVKLKDEPVDNEWLGKVVAGAGLTETSVTVNLKRLGPLLVDDNFPEVKQKGVPLLLYYQMFMLVFREFVKGGLRYSSIERDLAKREEVWHD